MNDTLAWAVAVLARACETSPHGKVTFFIEDGQPIRVVTETSEKAPAAAKQVTFLRPGLKDTR